VLLGAEFVLCGDPPLSSAFERDSERLPLRRREPSPSNPAIGGAWRRFDCDQNDAVRVNHKFLESWSQIFECRQSRSDHLTGGNGLNSVEGKVSSVPSGDAFPAYLPSKRTITVA
jgi:hypothetical protein